MDVLVDYINKHSDRFGVTVQYATISEYFQAVHQSNLTWEVREDQDFLPYSTGQRALRLLHIWYQLFYNSHIVFFSLFHC